MTEDLTVFLADWGEEGTIDSQPVFGIFAEPYGVDPSGNVGLSTSYPRFLLPTVSVPARGASDPVLELPLRQVAGKPWRYLVNETAPDGTTLQGGFTSLMLTQHQDQT